MFFRRSTPRNEIQLNESHAIPRGLVRPQQTQPDAAVNIANACGPTSLKHFQLPSQPLLLAAHANGHCNLKTPASRLCLWALRLRTRRDKLRSDTTVFLTAGAPEHRSSTSVSDGGG